MRNGKLKKAIVGVISCGMLSLGAMAVFPTSAMADRGGGSIRAAGRPSAPPPRAPAPPPRAPERAPERPPARQDAPHPEPGRPAPDEHRDVHAPPPPPRPDDRGRHDWDDGDERGAHFGGYGRGGVVVRIPRGQHVHVLPARYVPVVFGGISFYYDGDGDYYQPDTGGDYVVVQPPVGAIVPYLPDGIVSVVAGPTTYYYLDGDFYVQQDSGWAVVNPPPGIVVPAMPSAANSVVINGTVCYQFNGFNYVPSIQDGVTVYTVMPA